MIRSYVVTLAFVFARLFEEVAVYMGVSDFSDAEKAVVWFSWAVPLLLTEPLLQLRKFRQPVQKMITNVPSVSSLEGEVL